MNAIKTALANTFALRASPSCASQFSHHRATQVYRLSHALRHMRKKVQVDQNSDLNLPLLHHGGCDEVNRQWDGRMSLNDYFMHPSTCLSCCSCWL